MTPHEFLAKWRNVELKERSASQAHFMDLCRLLGIDDPVAADPKGEWFTFEKGATKTSGGEGWADVWRKSCFAWEYKGRAANLEKAFDQLLRYSIALESPPLLIVSDMERIFTLAAGVIGYLLNIDDIQATLLAPTCSAFFAFSLLALLSLGTVAALAFLVIAPRLASPSNEGLVFFDSVARRTKGEEYAQDIGAHTEEDLTEARLKHCYDISRVCSRKYGFLKKAIWLTPPSLMFALLTILLK